MRLATLCLLLAGCAARQKEPPAERPQQAEARASEHPDGYSEEVIAGLDAFDRGQFELSEQHALRALRSRDGAMARRLADISREARQGMPAYRRVLAEGGYLDLMIGALDAFACEDFDIAEDYVMLALRLRPQDPLAEELLDDSRKARHSSGGRYFEDLKSRRKALRDELARTRAEQGPGPPASP